MRAVSREGLYRRRLVGCDRRRRQQLAGIVKGDRSVVGVGACAISVAVNEIGWPACGAAGVTETVVLVYPFTVVIGRLTGVWHW